MMDEYEDMGMEDMAMGERPKKKMKKAEKKEPVSDAAKAKIKKIMAIVEASEGMSVKALKKFNKTELKMMCKAHQKLQDASYRIKDMIREAMPKESGKGRHELMMDDY